VNRLLSVMMMMMMVMRRQRPLQLVVVSFFPLSLPVGEAATFERKTVRHVARII
jgi:hypothetical protein